MRIQGKITFWKNEKGYGFITPSSGAKQVFVHISSFRSRDEQPRINQLVSFDLSTDKQGRPCAVRVVAAGEKMPDEIKRNDSSLWMLGAAFFLVLVVVSVLAGYISPAVLMIYLVMSVVTFLVYAVDKSAAQKNAWRTQESALHLLSLLGGWPGAIAAQQKLRHKSRKEEFRIVFWMTVVLNCGFYIWLYTASGSAFLESLIDGLVG